MANNGVNQERVIKPREPAIDLVRVISEGTYTTFAQALKEFVSNAYDAFATRVDIIIEEDCNGVTIRDDGYGMTLSEFENTFASIARTGGYSESEIPRRQAKKRKRIGRFGMGSLAIIGVADKFTVRSSKIGFTEGFQASIDLKEVRRNFYRDEDLSKCWVFRGSSWVRESKEYHYTEVIIEGLKDDIKNNLQSPGAFSIDDFFYRISELSGLDELSWRLGLICPVRYENDYPINGIYLKKPYDSFVIGLAKERKSDVFKVFLNNVEVTRRITLPSYHHRRLSDPDKAKYLLQRGLGFEQTFITSKKGTPYSYRGYILTQAMQLFPEELRGVLVRINDVAIGWHRTLFFPPDMAATVQQTTSCEVWVEGLDDALQFDRESFREDHPIFEDFRADLAAKLLEESRDARRRSRVRLEFQRAGKPPSTPFAKTPAKEPTDRKPKKDEEYDRLILTGIVEGQPRYITDVVDQINGCWYRGYFEACALLVRRLLETLIIELYAKRGLEADITNDEGRYDGLRKLIAILGSDKRFPFDRRKFIDPLGAYKKFGDYAAHEYKVLIRKQYIWERRDDLRFIIDRFVFELNRSKA